MIVCLFSLVSVLFFVFFGLVSFFVLFGLGFCLVFVKFSLFFVWFLFYLQVSGRVMKYITCWKNNYSK